MGLNIKNLRIVSPAFTSGDRIPKRYTSEGKNISPPLEWSGLPSGTKQLAMTRMHRCLAGLPTGFSMASRQLLISLQKRMAASSPKG